MLNVTGATDVERVYTSGRQGESIRVHLESVDEEFGERDIGFEFDVPERVEVYDVASSFYDEDTGRWILMAEVTPDSRVGVNFSFRRSDYGRDEIHKDELSVTVYANGEEQETLVFDIKG